MPFYLIQADYSTEGAKSLAGHPQHREEALGKVGKTAADVDLVIPHQANMRIIEAVAKKTGVPMDRVFTNVERYGNMSAATVPVALCEALKGICVPSNEENFDRLESHLSHS